MVLLDVYYTIGGRFPLAVTNRRKRHDPENWKSQEGAARSLVVEVECDCERCNGLDGTKRLTLMDKKHAKKWFIGGGGHGRGFGWKKWPIGILA